MNMHMKKSMHLIMATTLLVAIFTGCSTKDKIEEKTTEISEAIESDLNLPNNEDFEGEDGYIHSDSIDFDSITEEFKDIDPSVYDTLPTITSLTREQLFDFSIDQLRAFVSLYAPDYRQLYIIDDDLVMEEKEWNTLRSIISYQLFGTLRNPNQTYDEFEEETIKNLEENALVRAQDYASGEENLDNDTFIQQLEDEKEAILSMDQEEFISYVNDLFVQTGYTNEDGSAFDVSTFDVETLDEMKASMIQDIDDEISTLKGETVEEEKSIQDQLIEQGQQD